MQVSGFGSPSERPKVSPQKSPTRSPSGSRGSSPSPGGSEGGVPPTRVDPSAATVFDASVLRSLTVENLGVEGDRRVSLLEETADASRVATRRGSGSIGGVGFYESPRSEKGSEEGAAADLALGDTRSPLKSVVPFFGGGGGLSEGTPAVVGSGVFMTPGVGGQSLGFPRNSGLESTGSNASTRSETAKNLSPSMRELYKSLGLGKGSAVGIGEATPDFVQRLNLESETVVTEAIQYRDHLEARVLSQEVNLGILENAIIQEQINVSRLSGDKEILEAQIADLGISLKDKKSELDGYTTLLAKQTAQYGATKKLVQKLSESKAALELGKEQLELEIQSLKQTISPEDAAALEQKIAQKYQASMHTLSDELRSAQVALGSVSAELASEKVTSQKNEAVVNSLQDQLERSQADVDRRGRDNAALQNDIAGLKRALEAQSRMHREQLAKLKPAEPVALIRRPGRESTISFGNTTVILDSTDLDHSQAPGTSSQRRLQRAANKDETANLLQVTPEAANEDALSAAGSEKGVSHSELQTQNKEARKAALLAKKQGAAALNTEDADSK